MGSHRNQHIVPKTYLKYFSQNENGKGIFVLYNFHPFKKRIHQTDSGSTTFCKPNFYNTAELPNYKTIELFLGQRIEPNYNYIIQQIKQQIPIDDFNLKIRLMEWLIYAKMRSPSWRELFRIELKDIGHNLDFDSKELREEHLQIFSNEKTLDFVLDYFDKNLSTKKWFILKAPANKSWLTSDNPGFSINVEEYNEEKDELIPNAFWTGIRHDTILYFPLTKDYCLQIQPYNMGDDVKLNIRNTPIKYQKATENDVKIINAWTYMTQHEILISATSDRLKNFEEIKNKSE